MTVNPRNDGFMYTGINSVTRDKATVRERALEAKKEVQHEIEPFAPKIMARIAKEKANMGELLANLVTANDSPEKVAQHIEAVKLHRLWLISFEQEIKNDLRTGRAKPIKQGDSFEEIIEAGKNELR